MDRILIILKKENGPRASSFKYHIFKHIYVYAADLRRAFTGPLMLELDSHPRKSSFHTRKGVRKCLSSYLSQSSMHLSSNIMQSLERFTLYAISIPAGHDCIGSMVGFPMCS